MDQTWPRLPSRPLLLGFCSMCKSQLAHRSRINWLMLHWSQCEAHVHDQTPPNKASLRPCPAMKMLPALQEHLGVVKDIVFEGCSPRVEQALSADIMRSAKSIIPDLLASLPMLLYQGPLQSTGQVTLLLCCTFASLHATERNPRNLNPCANQSIVLLDGRPKRRSSRASPETQGCVPQSVLLPAGEFDTQDGPATSGMSQPASKYSTETWNNKERYFADLELKYLHLQSNMGVTSHIIVPPKTRQPEAGRTACRSLDTHD